MSSPRKVTFLCWFAFLLLFTHISGSRNRKHVKEREKSNIKKNIWKVPVSFRVPCLKGKCCLLTYYLLACLLACYTISIIPPRFWWLVKMCNLCHGDVCIWFQNDAFMMPWDSILGEGSIDKWMMESLQYGL